MYIQVSQNKTQIGLDTTEQNRKTNVTYGQLLAFLRNLALHPLFDVL
jgi:hypothetical protein